jgi:hypothetical protein
MKPQPESIPRGADEPIQRDADGNPIIYQWRYGIHELQSTLKLNPPADRRKNEVITNDRLIAAARSELEAAGEQSDLTIMAAVTVDKPGAVPFGVAAALKEWCRGIFERHRLSRLLLASHFLVSWQLSRLLITTDTPQETKEQELCFFAHAFHRWHMEVFQEHDNACFGQHMAVSRSKGPAATSKRKDVRRAVIVRETIDVIGDNAVSCTFMAGRIKNINRALEQAGAKPFPTETALRDALKKIRAAMRRGELASSPSS